MRMDVATTLYGVQQQLERKACPCTEFMMLTEYRYLILAPGAIPIALRQLDPDILCWVFR